MDRKKLNTILKQVIREAQELNIPVPDYISEEIIVNPRPKKRFGCCTKKNGIFQIEISAFVLTCTEDKVRGIIAHEVLHACKGCQDHGVRWKAYAAMMNEAYGYRIKRVSSLEELGITKEPEENTRNKIKYIIKCTKCGKEYPRQRFTCVMQKINAYRCQCGGTLVLYRRTDEIGR